ncbi:MAG TPA: hypothetical protein VNQ90_06445 [Chthoniobacteraceae bacterium]|nr:hypothetical protein [Chthoniobacteraceae bacterium]
MTAVSCSRPKPDTATPLFLRPVASQRTPAGHEERPVAFYQAVALAPGEMKPGGGIRLRDAAGPLTAIATPAAFWPDGSIRWLAVDGVMTRKATSAEPIAISRLETAPPAPQGARTNGPQPEIVDDAHAIRWKSADGQTLFDLVPQASFVRIDQPKRPQPTDIGYLEQTGQYAWAEPLEALATDTAPVPMTLRVLKSEVEEENDLFTLYRIVGNGGESAPGNRFEWQLRARVYRTLPLIRTSMTWVVRWDAARYALTSAKWTVRTPQPWEDFVLLDDEAAKGKGSTTLQIASQPDGRNVVSKGSGAVEEAAWPTISRDGLVARGAGRSMAVGIPNFTRLGPNYLAGTPDGVEIASWSEGSGKGLDLRRSGADGEFGIGSVDLSANGSGFARTLNASLVFFDDPALSAAVAHDEAARDGLWFASAEECERTGVLGPFRRAAVDANPAYFAGLHANLLFLVRSRDHWRWNGLVNFGDFRTNFARGNVPERGLFAGHWALNGRYGWRNASASINYSLIRSGLFLEDRELVLAGIDHAEHVADVDTVHASFFSPPSGEEGGMHRRNRDHWSGNPQMQYTPSKGIYLSNWLNGTRRVSQVLEEVREYARRDGGQSSAFAGQAWIMRYMETGDRGDYELASRFLENAAGWWKEHSGTPLDGLAALYANNFRRISDGMETLILFHEATGSDRYLQAMKQSIVAHGLPETPNPKLDVPSVIGYLLSNGVKPGELGLPLLKATAAQIREFIPAAPPFLAQARWEDLARIVLHDLPPEGNPTYRESAAIAGRSNYAFSTLEHFGATSPYHSKD